MSLRFLATGNSQVSIMIHFDVLLFQLSISISSSQAPMSYVFRMSRSTLCHVLVEVCDAIWKVSHPEYLKMPTSKTEWLSISKDFEELWNFPNCAGAIDGKHVVIQAPKNAGSSFFNYKGTLCCPSRCV